MSTVKNPVADSIFASLPRTTRGVPIILGGCPQGKHKFLYTNGNNVILRDLANPYMDAEIITKHSTPATVAQWSPSGFYIASGDTSGKVLIWDTVNKEHLTKYEYQPIVGKINDITWDGESKRMAVGGQGKGKYGHAFLVDSGSSVGEVVGHTKAINSLSIRPQRPYRLVTCSEDYSMVFFEGPPFKFKKTIADHTAFVNALRYAPKGEVFISGGADKQAFVYDGKTGDKIGQLGDPAHSGGIYALSFNIDGKKVLTCSGDKTCKIWDVETTTCETTFNMGTQVNDMQVGCLWQDDYLISISLSGYINYLDINNPDKPRQIIKGTNKAVTAMCLSEDKSTVFSGSSDGHINYMRTDTFEDGEMIGKGHSNKVMDMRISEDTMVSVGMDDCVIFSNTESKQYPSEFIKLGSQPQATDTKSGTTVVACLGEVVVFEGNQKKFVQTVPYEPKSVCLNSSGTVAAIAGLKDNTIHIYDLGGGTLSEINKVKTTGEITDMEFSPDGQFLATSGADRYVRCYELPDYQLMFDSTKHSARVNCVSWSPDSTKFATGSLDTSFVVWDIRKKGFDKQYLCAHALNNITRIVWESSTNVLTAASDSCIKRWTV
ncbi:WD repeat-containing protein 1-like [Ylistrum balloti]|uniref:WD repeat-containing protein 1-like n=1 Tax=Ylistrum balloti TaxID=509963 RepID=UPI002905F7A4|nr:WD repeat-containing protein 1-like [Ylistrum balloti]